MSTTTESATSEEESALQERLKRVEYDTLEGDTCRAEIIELEESRGDVRVKVELPSGRTHGERYDLPEVASDEYEFVRLLDSAGYGLSAVDHAVGADVEVRIEDDGPEIVVPEPKQPLTLKAMRKVPEPALMGFSFFALVAAFPLTGVQLLQAFDEHLFSGGAGTAFGWLFYGFGLFFWAITFGVVGIWGLEVLLP